MNKFQTLILGLLIVLLIFRIFQNYPLHKSSKDPELESIASNFISTRAFLSDTITRLLPKPQAALLNGILLGEKSKLSKDFNNALRRTSTIHIVVVSGQNLTILIGFVMNLVSFLGRKKTIVLSMITIFIYSLLTGMQIPVLRAALMVGLSLIAQALGRDKDSAWILFITALVMLIYQPNWLLSVSFQLSFLATIGVVIVAPEIIKNLKFIPEIAREDLGVSLAAQALTWPVIASNFHQASLVGLIVNALVLWIVSLVMISGIFTLAAGILNLTLGSLLALIPGAMLTYFIYIVNFFNTLPFASIYISKTSPFVWVGYYLLLIGLFLILRHKNSQTP